jgi:hypothetical protein
MKWEYKTLSYYLTNAPNDQELNKLGLEGWELLSTFCCGNEWITYIFKRPIKPKKTK